MENPITFRIIRIILIVAFAGSSINIPQSQAIEIALPSMPIPGAMVNLSPSFAPAIVQGLTIDVKNPFAFTFLIDRGDSPIAEGQKKDSYEKLIKYFLAAMTIAEDKQWVNLSPYEKNRIIDNDFGKTEMGRDLLVQDYMLKQITASLLYPEAAIGKEFWHKVYEQASEAYGTTQIPINTFNKVWITPDKASVYEKDRTVLIVDSQLKVQLEEDYLSAEKNRVKLGAGSPTVAKEDPKGIAKKVLLDIVIPALNKEVNEGKNFANLRQMYHGMILATWYKQALKKSILTQAYANQNKVQGVNLLDPQKAQQEVYQQYLKAFRKGVYNFIKEESDPLTGQVNPRKYFSGGYTNLGLEKAMVTATADQAAAKFDPQMVKRLDAAMADIISSERNKARPDAAMFSFYARSVLPYARYILEETRAAARQMFGARFVPTPNEGMGKQEGFTRSEEKPSRAPDAFFYDHLKTGRSIERLSARDFDDIVPGEGGQIIQLLSRKGGLSDAVAGELAVPINWNYHNPFRMNELALADKEIVINGRPRQISKAEEEAIHSRLIDVSRLNQLLQFGEFYKNWGGLSVDVTSINGLIDALYLTEHKANPGDAQEALVRIGPDAVPALMEVLKNPADPRVYYVEEALIGIERERGELSQFYPDKNLHEQAITYLKAVMDLVDQGKVEGITMEAHKGQKVSRAVQILRAVGGRVEDIDLLFDISKRYSSGLDSASIYWMFQRIGEQIEQTHAADFVNRLRAEYALRGPGRFDYSPVEMLPRAVNIITARFPEFADLQSNLAGTTAVLSREEAERQVEEFMNGPNGNLLENRVGSDRIEKAKPIAAELLRELHGKPLDYKVSDLTFTKGDVTTKPEVNLNAITDQMGMVGISTFTQIVYLRMLGRFKRPDLDGAMEARTANQPDQASVAAVGKNKDLGGIDLDAANLNLQIKRDGTGVPLPLAQQDMAQLSHIQGFVPRILEIRPAASLQIFSELKQQLQAQPAALASAT